MNRTQSTTPPYVAYFRVGDFLNGNAREIAKSTSETQGTVPFDPDPL